MADNSSNGLFTYLVIEEIVNMYLLSAIVVTIFMLKRATRKRRRAQNRQQYSLIARIPKQVGHLNRPVNVSDVDGISNLRMDRNTFGKLCTLLRELGGLQDSKYVSVEAQVAMFLGVIAHHKKNQVTAFDFLRSGETVSHYIHVIMGAILKIQNCFLTVPTPINNNCPDPRWNQFLGCLGALDGTYIEVTVPASDKPRFRNRKGQICTNTLAACDPNMRFSYILLGWEGSAVDGRVLRDAVNRPHGLKVPRDKDTLLHKYNPGFQSCYYYLCDNGYANSEGFLTPFKGVRYHLKEWGPDAAVPNTPAELYNMRHTKARNVIERAFGVLKLRWGMLQSASFYPLKVQIRLIMCCFLLHNFIRTEMAEDPIEQLFDSEAVEDTSEGLNEGVVHMDFIDAVEGSTEWNMFRDDLANSMWDQFTQ